MKNRKYFKLRFGLLNIENSRFGNRSSGNSRYVLLNTENSIFCPQNIENVRKY